MAPDRYFEVFRITGRESDKLRRAGDLGGIVAQALNHGLINTYCIEDDVWVYWMKRRG